MVSYLASIWQCRYFWISLVKMDLRTRYRRSILGLGWSLLHPIAMTVILCIVFQRLFGMGLREYAPNVIAGLAFWNFFQGVTLSGCGCFFQAESYIRQYPSPLAIFPLRTALGAGIHLLLALSVVIALSWVLLGPPALLPLLSLFPTLLLMFLLGWAMALLAGFATVMFQDTEHLSTVAFQIMFYATPIIYPATKLKELNLAWILRCNPLIAFLDLLRAPINDHEFPSLQSYAIAGATVLVVMAVASLVLARLQRRFIFYL